MFSVVAKIVLDFIPVSYTIRQLGHQTLPDCLPKRRTLPAYNDESVRHLENDLIPFVCLRLIGYFWKLSVERLLIRNSIFRFYYSCVGKVSVGILI